MCLYRLGIGREGRNDERGGLQRGATFAMCLSEVDCHDISACVRDACRGKSLQIFCIVTLCFITPVCASVLHVACLVDKVEVLFVNVYGQSWHRKL